MKIIPAIGEGAIPQRSEAWQALHVGRVTASCFHKICTPAKLEYAKGARTELYRLAAERLLGESFGPSLDGLEFVELGRTREPEAIQQYEVLQDLVTVPVSFIMTDDERVGCSPDALVANDFRHGLEIKSLFPPKMIKLLMEGQDAEHRVQVLGQMWVAELDVADYFAYNPYTPPYLGRWLRTDCAKDIATVASHVTRFADELDKAVETLNAEGFFTKRETPVTKLDELVERMRFGDPDNRETFPGIENLPTIAELDRWKDDPTNKANLENMPVEKRELILESWQFRRAFLGASTP